jgi:hypothetical protein
MAVLILTVNPVIRDTTRATVCADKLPYLWKGNSINAAGTWLDTLSSPTGCDTMAVLILTVNPVIRDTTRAAICADKLPYLWKGNSINAAGTWRDTLSSPTGCDTLAVLILTVNPVIRDTTRATVCSDKLPYLWKGNSISAAGTWLDTLSATTGCDTLAVLILTVNPLIRDTTRAAICADKLPYQWKGNSISTAGTWLDTLSSPTGCDTMAVLILTVNPLIRDTTRAAICADKLPYLWKGNSISAAGTWLDTL